MREFSKVNQSIWSSKKFAALSDRHKLFYLYCLTCKHGNSAGCFYLPAGYVMVDLKWTEREVLEAIDRVCDSLLIAYNRDENIAYISRWFDYNPPTNPKHAAKVISDLAGIACCDLLERTLADFSGCLAAQNWKLLEKSREAIDSLCHRVSSKMSTETLTSTETETKTGIPKGILGDPKSPRADPKISLPEIQMEFERFWNAYPGVGKDGQAGAAFKGSKEKARKSFEAVLKKEKDYAGLNDRIVAACRNYGEHLARSGYPSKHCATWITGKCWEDDYSSATQSARPNTDQSAKPYSHTIIDAAERAKEQLRTQGSRGFNAADQLAALEQRGLIPRRIPQEAGSSGDDNRTSEEVGGAQAHGPQ